MSAPENPLRAHLVTILMLAQAICAQTAVDQDETLITVRVRSTEHPEKAGLQLAQISLAQAFRNTQAALDVAAPEPGA